MNRTPAIASEIVSQNFEKKIKKTHKILTNAFAVVWNCQITGIRRAASQNRSEHVDFLQSRSLFPNQKSNMASEEMQTRRGWSIADVGFLSI